MIKIFFFFFFNTDTLWVDDDWWRCTNWLFKKKKRFTSYIKYRIPMFFMFLYLFTSPCSVCDSGKWQCSENFCPARCVVEGQYVTTYDGKQYSVPGKCTYMASQVTHFCLNHYLPPTLLYKLTARLYSFRVTTGGYTLSISKGRPLWRQSLFSFFRYKQSETATLITFNQITFNMKVQVYNFPSFFVFVNLPGNVSILTQHCQSWRERNPRALSIW